MYTITGFKSRRKRFGVQNESIVWAITIHSIHHYFIVRYGLFQKHTRWAASRMDHLPSAVARLQPFTHPTMDEEEKEIVVVFVESQISI